jgi:hypothetical protein
LSTESRIDLSHSQLTVDNCTFYANAHDDISPAAINVYMEDSHAIVRNSVIWGVPGDPYNFDTYLLRPQSGATMEVHHSLVEGWSGSMGGVGNSGDDPMFVDADGADDIANTEDDDLRFLPVSPAINGGDPDETYLSATDLDGHARVLCGRVDMGAYEFGIGDYDCDQTVDLTDFSQWAACMTGPAPPTSGGATGCEAFDANGDGDVDLHDFYHIQPVFVMP